MDQVIDAALLDAPHEEVQEMYTRPPLLLDEHRDPHDITPRRSSVIANEQWEQDGIDPFMIPQVEQHSHDAPQANAKRDNP